MGHSMSNIIDRALAKNIRLEIMNYCANFCKRIFLQEIIALSGLGMLFGIYSAYIYLIFKR